MLARMIRKSLLRGARTNIWMLLTLTLCAALVAMFVTVSTEMEAKMRAAFRSLGANAVAYAAAEDVALADESGEALWKTVETTATATGAEIVTLRGRIGLVEGKPVLVVTADPDGLAQMTPYWDVRGARAMKPGEALVGKRVAAAFDLAAGETLTVEWRDARSVSDLHVVGVLESGDDDEDRIFTAGLEMSPMKGVPMLLAMLPPSHPNVRDLLTRGAATCTTCHEARTPTGNPSTGTTNAASIGEASGTAPGLTYALLSVPGGAEGIDRLANRLQEAGTGVVLNPLRQIVQGELTVLAKIRLLSGIVLAAVLALTALGISAAMLARIVERRAELALLRALGAVRRSIVVFLLYESGVLGLIGTALGFVLGTVLADLVTREVFRVSASPHLIALVAALLATTGVALLAGGLAARRALRLQPALALKGE